MQSVIRKHKTLLFLPAFISFLVLLPYLTQRNVSASENVHPELEELLSDYSQYLALGSTSRKSHYSPALNELVRERRE